MAQKLRTTGFPLNCPSVTGCFVSASMSLKSGATDPGRMGLSTGLSLLVGCERRVVSILCNAGFVLYRNTPNIRPSAAPANSSFL